MDVEHGGRGLAGANDKSVVVSRAITEGRRGVERVLVGRVVSSAHLCSAPPFVENVDVDVVRLGDLSVAVDVAKPIGRVGGGTEAE